MPPTLTDGTPQDISIKLVEFIDALVECDNTRQTLADMWRDEAQHRAQKKE